MISACIVSALFDRPICGYNHVPQGHGVDQFYREGILMLSVTRSPTRADPNVDRFASTP